jgi:hypothetical protein
MDVFVVVSGYIGEDGADIDAVWASVAEALEDAARRNAADVATKPEATVVEDAYSQSWGESWIAVWSLLKTSTGPDWRRVEKHELCGKVA